MKTFTITYAPRAMNDVAGFDYEIRSNGRLLADGWSPGKRHHAEQQARAHVRELDNKAA